MRRTSSMTTVTQIQPRKKRRVFLWFFLAVQVLFLVWAIAGGHSAATSPVDCSSVTVEQCQTLKDAQDVGAGIGVGIIVLFWFLVDIFLGVVYGVYRLAKRP